MRIRAQLFFITIIMIAAFTTGCTDTSIQASQNGVMTITDDTGIQVTIPKYPTSVISLAPSETEIFYGINTNNSGISLVGRNDYDDYPKEVESVPSVGGPHTLSIESIVSKDPDLIITTTVADKTIIEQLRNLGYPVLIFELNTFEDVYRNIDSLGEALGLTESADNLIQSMTSKVTDIENMPHKTPPPKTMYVVAVEPLYVAGNNTLQNDMIELSGGVNIFDLDGYFVASEEAVIDRAPEVIIVPSGHGTMNVDFKDQFLSKNQFSDVPAVKNGRVYTVEDNLVSRPGPRITEGLELFYNCINAETQ